MTGILLIFHGSREPIYFQQIFQLTKTVAQAFPRHPLKNACLQFGKNTVKSGLEALQKAGVEQIFVIPCFLFDGIHTQKDIPEMVEEFRRENPQIQVDISGCLGIEKDFSQMIISKITKNIS